MNMVYVSQIGGGYGQQSDATFYAFNPQTNKNFGEPFYCAQPADVDRACQLAAQAASEFAQTSGAQRAHLLRRIAVHIEALIPSFVELTTRETGLPETRIRGESARTIGQLNLFAQLLEEGSWVDARIDHGDATRLPLPKPDVRSMAIAMGPVAVFGASNFPLAFSTAGVDTVAALAAGCPVVVKAHPAHPHTSALAAHAIKNAALDCQLPAGIFSHLIDNGINIGGALVRHPAIKAVGFTGSLKAGRALFDACAQRAEPIPVYAEMGSTNPQFILPAALLNRGAAIASGLAASVLNGVGQFCTCPGLVFALKSEALELFITALQTQLAQQGALAMLAPSIAANYMHGCTQQAAQTGVQTLLSATQKGCQVTPSLLRCSGNDFAESALLQEEVFGPSTVVVVLDNAQQMAVIAQHLPGQLASSIHMDETDSALAATLMNALQHNAGRVQFNGFPTGVEVCHAMVHGGPYPACTDARVTSVGSSAIERFVRRVAFQNAPDALLPAALQEANPLRLMRMVDGDRRR